MTVYDCFECPYNKFGGCILMDCTQTLETRSPFMDDGPELLTTMESPLRRKPNRKGYISEKE